MGANERGTFEVSAEEGSASYDEASGRALARIEELGISVIPEQRPVNNRGEFFDGRLPSNLSEMSLDTLGDLLGLMTEYTDYLEMLLAVAKSEMDSTKEQLDLVRALLRKNKKGTDKSKADDVIIDDRYVEANAKYMEAKTYHDILETNKNVASRRARMLSRMIEVKRIKAQTSGRTYNTGRDAFRK